MGLGFNESEASWSYSGFNEFRIKVAKARLFGIPVYEHTRYEQVQRRRHRKKRIDKKWRKRYGLKTVEVDEMVMLDTSFMNWKPSFAPTSFLPDM